MRPLFSDEIQRIANRAGTGTFSPEDGKQFWSTFESLLNECASETKLKYEVDVQ